MSLEKAKVQGKKRLEVKLDNLGMQGLEYVLNGGFPVDSVYMLNGPSGTYYTAFAQQALYNHIIGKGKVVYYNVETPCIDTEQDMATFHWEIDKYLDDGSWVFARIMPPQLQKLEDIAPDIPYEARIKTPGTSLTPLAEHFLGMLKKGYWSCLNLSYLMRLYPANEIVDLVMFWVNAVHRLGGIHFILATNGGTGDELLNQLKSLTDGVLTFKFAQGFEQTEGEIEIEKMRRVIPKAKTIRHVVQDDGIAIETTARVG